MALLFCDSFDHYTTLAQALTKWTTSAGSPTINAASRFGAGALRVSSAQNLQRTVASSAGPYIWGFAFYYTSAPVADTVIFTTLESTTVHADLRLTPTGTLRATRNGTSLGLGTAVLSQLTWYYIEVKITINNTTGVFAVKLNGVSELNLTSQDTQNGGTGVIDNYRLGYNGSGQASDPAFYDDHVMLDTTGSAPNNDFIGDVRVEALLPNGNGNSSQWVGQDADSTDNYLNVDEASPDDNTTYNESGTVSNKDTYAYSNLTPGSGTVYGVQIVPYARKTDSGSRSIVSVARLSATEVDSSNKALTTTYLYLPDMRETKPGGGAWSVSDVNSAEFGAKVSV